MLFSKFKDYLHCEKSFSTNTIIAYMKDLKSFQFFLNQRGGEISKELNYSFIRQWIVYLSENNSTKSRMTFVSPLGGNQFVSADIAANTDSTQEVNFDLSALDNWSGVINNFAFQIIEPSSVEGESPITSSGVAIIDRILFSTENPLSISDIDILDNFQIYPNPTRDVIYLKSSHSISSVSISDMLGQNIYNKQKNISSINVSNLSPGLYILKAYFVDGSQRKRKFIIK